MITHVAIKDIDNHIWSLPKPHRHADIIALMPRSAIPKSVQGFLNCSGVFLTRKQAWFEAFDCCQILPPYNPLNPSDRRGKPNDIPSALFSEDLW